jgi:hypothetical protein
MQVFHFTIIFVQDATFREIQISQLVLEFNSVFGT